MAVPNSNFADSLIAATFNKFISLQPKDAIFNDIPFFEALNSKAKIKRKGGVKLLTPLQYAKSTSGGSYNGSDPLSVTPHDALTNAEFEWKQYQWPVVINGREEAINSGDEAKIDLLQHRWDDAKMSMKDNFAEDLFLDGTGNSSKDIIGLALAVDSAGTYGNISRTTNTWWGSQETAVSGALTIEGASGMRRKYNDCGRGSGSMLPTMIVTTQILHEAYEALMAPYIRFGVNDNTAAINGQKLVFKRATLDWDDYCQSGVMYFLNPMTFELVVVPERDFAAQPFKTTANQDVQIAQIFWMGALGCNNCRHNGKLTGLTNA